MGGTRIILNKRKAKKGEKKLSCNISTWTPADMRNHTILQCIVVVNAQKKIVI